MKKISSFFSQNDDGSKSFCIILLQVREIDGIIFFTMYLVLCKLLAKL